MESAKMEIAESGCLPPEVIPRERYVCSSEHLKKKFLKKNEGPLFFRWAEPKEKKKKERESIQVTDFLFLSLLFFYIIFIYRR
ncbi:hypothetical protein BSKO_02624 [Bryopsis sp. KO-2023]|nr:hypothetical protein BSKO_02624 [Bryopsis sp. KO-2023]